MAVALIEHQAGGFALEFGRKGTALLGHQTPLCGEHSRLNGCQDSLDHYKTFLHKFALGDHSGLKLIRRGFFLANSLPNIRLQIACFALNLIFAPEPAGRWSGYLCR